MFFKEIMLIFVLYLIAGITSSNATKDLSSDRDLLNGKHFVIEALKFVPYGYYTNVSSSGKINDVSGFANEIMLYMARKYQFNFEYVQPYDEVFGAYTNGSWNGLTGMLCRNEVDMGSTIIVTYPRSQVIDFSVQFSEDPISLLIPYPKMDSTINGIVRPFSSQVWFFIGISIVTVTIFLWTIISAKWCFFQRTERNTTRPTLYNTFWSLLHIQKIVDPKVFSRPSQTPVYLTLFSWCLVVIVLSNAYSSTLMSYLVAPRYLPMIDSIEDIVNISRPVFMVLKHGAYDSAVLNADRNNSLVLSKIGDSLREHPELRLTQAEVEQHVADLIINHQRSYTKVKSELLIRMERDWKQTGQCRLYLAKKPWDMSRVALAFPKSSPLTHIFSTEINRLRDAGILDYWHRRNWPCPNLCSEPLITKIDSYVTLNVNYFLSNFVLLGGGILAALLVLIIEVIIMENLARNEDDLQEKLEKLFDI